MTILNYCKLTTIKLPVIKIVVSIFIASLTPSLLVAEDIKIINLQKSDPTIAVKAEPQTTSMELKATEPAKPVLNVLYKTFNLTPEAALLVAQAAMKNCSDSGYQVSVAILDRGGNIQVLLRDRLAGNTTPDIAMLKAKTALGFKASTSSLVNAIAENKHLSGVRDVPDTLILAGGITISAAGTIIGSVGVSGAPDSKFDERCAIIGLKPIKGMLEFAE